MNFYFFPDEINNKIKNIDVTKVFEIRLRLNQEILIFIENQYVFLRDLIGESCICDKDLINFIINTTTDNSIYAYNEQIKKGYINGKNGIRLGICGKVITDKGEVKTINNFSSINIRIPHSVIGCSKKIFNRIIVGNETLNTLIFSSPFMGKTTILKDIALNINNLLKKQTLIIDERFEFNDIEGEYIDKIQNSSKEYAFETAIRSMSPEIIICDEIIGKNDWNYLVKANTSGIKIIASVHADSIIDIEKKKYFNKNIFERYVHIKKSNFKGQVFSIYDKSFNKIS